MCYDANGNQTLGYNFTQNRPRTITWTSYNKPKTITEAEQTVTFSYGADRSRFKQTNAFAGETTIYVDGVYERRTIGTLHEHVHYIVADGMAVAIYRSASDGIQSTRYLHRDHLDSVVEVTNESGSVVESFSFDAWGARRNPVNWSDAATQIYGNETPRGYTGHEHLDDIGLVHMNGRVQDPKLGRMLSADPFVQFPDYSQSFNRYSYVLNNPLTHTDPTGYCLSAGPSCATGGFVPGLGGAIGGTRSATISKSYGYHYSFVAIQFQLSFPGIWSYGGVPNVAACYLPGCVASYYLDGHYPPGFGAPTLTIAVYVVQGGYYRAVAPSYGPVNDHVGSGWFAKLWGRWTAPVQEPQGGVPIGAIASMGGAAAVEAGAGGAGFWSSVYSGSTAVARTVVSVPFAVLMSIPANGFWGNSAERCFDAPATAGCPGAAVWNESSKGDGSPNNALNADQTSPGDPNQFDPDETENRLHHIFNSRSHDTKELLALSRELGGNRAAYQAIRSAALQEIRAQGLGEGVYRVGVNVAGRSFTVQGIIRDGVVRIGSMW